jgi:hypothetical protein
MPMATLKGTRRIKSHDKPSQNTLNNHVFGGVEKESVKRRQTIPASPKTLRAHQRLVGMGVWSWGWWLGLGVAGGGASWYFVARDSNLLIWWLNQINGTEFKVASNMTWHNGMNLHDGLMTWHDDMTCCHYMEIWHVAITWWYVMMPCHYVKGREGNRV